jgi:predicted HAD superfamily hydrolase
MRKEPDWDVLVCADEAEEASYLFFPADKVIANLANLAALEGLRFRNCYVTSKAIEKGSGNLFQHLYFNARITGGKVLHITDYRESE